MPGTTICPQCGSRCEGLMDFKDTHTNQSLTMCSDCLQKHMFAAVEQYNKRGNPGTPKPASLFQRLRRLF